MIMTMARLSSPIFVGRASELERLHHALQLASDHRPTTRLVAGDAGIGKTRLMSEFVAGRGRQAHTSSSGTAFSSERPACRTRRSSVRCDPCSGRSRLNDWTR